MHPLLVAVLIAATGFLSGSLDPLADARRLGAGRFADFRYKLGGAENDQKTDCTQFIVAVLQETLGTSRVPLRGQIASRARVQIDEVYALSKSGKKEAARELLDELVDDRRDIRTRGVQYALEAAGLGERVASIREARPGDLVQYWAIGRDGHWSGHVAVISSISGTRAGLYGAHESLGRAQGACVGELPGRVDLGPASGRIVYIVRLTP